MTTEEAIRSKLEENLGQVLFSDLSAHLERDAVFIVGAELSIVDCAVAVATDDVASVGPWLERGALRKPSRGERSAWAAAEGRRWWALVVQPFVLVQDPS